MESGNETLWAHTAVATAAISTVAAATATIDDPLLSADDPLTSLDDPLLSFDGSQYLHMGCWNWAPIPTLLHWRRVPVHLRWLGMDSSTDMRH